MPLPRLNRSARLFSLRSLSVAALLMACLVAAAASGAAAQVGRVTTGASGLPLPRFVSIKADRANVRVGPGEDYPIAWVFTRAGIPIEIIQEYATWRQVRDSNGSVGWVYQGLLSGERTAVVAPWDTGDILPLRSGPSEEAAVSAYLEAGVLGSVRRCDQGWCRIGGEGFSGWIEQSQLWGVYPDEKID